MMELTDGGWYKTPRIIKGKDFLAHIHDTYASGNAMYVEFKASEGEVRILEYRRLYDVDTESAVLFTINTFPQESILLKNIEEYEFIQYRPQQAWKAIHMGSTKRFSVSDFDDLYIDQTFRKMTPVAFTHNNQYWTVMGLELASAETGWFIYLKRQDKDFMIRVDFTSDQKFIFNPLSNSWSLDYPTQEITDLEGIKKALKSEDVSEVIVSGVPMRLVRVQEIAKDVLFFVFLDTSEARRYYYARHTTKLRIVENEEKGIKEYLLDHIKAMHID